MSAEKFPTAKDGPALPSPCLTCDVVSNSDMWKPSPANNRRRYVFVKRTTGTSTISDEKEASAALH